MPVADVYVHYVNKVERKDRTEAELIKVITWLTGFDSKTLKNHLKKQTTFKEFFKAAKIHPNAKLITGSICGVKIAEIEDPLMKKIRYMDKLVDELAKGRPMEKILRSGLQGDSSLKISHSYTFFAFWQITNDPILALAVYFLMVFFAFNTPLKEFCNGLHIKKTPNE